MIAVSGEIRNTLIRAGARPDRVEVVLNGIDETRFRPQPELRAAARERFGLDPGQVVVGSVGRLKPQKRFDLLIEAFAALRRDRPSLRLLIAGEGSSRSGLEERIRAWQVEDACRRVGHCSDVPEFYRALDLFVQSSAYEGTPNVVLEAMALGIPVVATDVGGTAALVRDGVDGLIVPPLDLTRLIAATGEALDGPDATRARRVGPHAGGAGAGLRRADGPRRGRLRTDAGASRPPTERGPMMPGRDALKALANAAALVAVFPQVVSFRIRARLMGSDRALEGSTQLLALLPGLFGQYIRRAFLRCTLEHCDVTATIEFGTIFSQCSARIDAYAYVGPRCHLGWVHIERDVLVAAGVHIPSGGRTHGIDDPVVPIREQAHSRSMVRIGAGAWIGSAAVVMADVGAHTVVGAGAVVTRTLPDCAIAAGVPAKVVRYRADRPLSA